MVRYLVFHIDDEKFARLGYKLNNDSVSVPCNKGDRYARMKFDGFCRSNRTLLQCIEDLEQSRRAVPSFGQFFGSPGYAGVSQLEAKLSDYKAENARLRSELEYLRSRPVREDRTADIDRLEGEVEELRNANEDLRNANARLEEECKMLRREVPSGLDVVVSRTEYDDLTAQNNLMVSMLASAKESAASETARASALEEELRGSRAECDDLKTSVRSLASDLDRYGKVDVGGIADGLLQVISDIDRISASGSMEDMRRAMDMYMGILPGKVSGYGLSLSMHRPGEKLTEGQFSPSFVPTDDPELDYTVKDTGRIGFTVEGFPGMSRMEEPVLWKYDGKAPAAEPESEREEEDQGPADTDAGEPAKMLSAAPSVAALEAGPAVLHLPSPEEPADESADAPADGDPPEPERAEEVKE